MPILIGLGVLGKQVTVFLRHQTALPRLPWMGNGPVMYAKKSSGMGGDDMEHELRVGSKEDKLDF